MPRSTNHPLFFLPALLLIGFVILSFVVEESTEEKESTTYLALKNEILNDAIQNPRQVQLIQALEKEQEGEKYHLYISLCIILSGIGLIYSLFRNSSITRRRVELARSAERYNALFAAALQSMRVGVAIRDVQDPKQPIIFVNKAGCDLTGYTAAEMHDKPPGFLFGWGTDPATVNEYHRAIQEGRSTLFDVLIYRKDGSPFWGEWRISPVLGENGVMTHYVSLLTDITEMRQTQDALLTAKEQAEHASAVKTNFLAVMSHEIRTPINGLLGVLNLMGDSVLNADQRKLLAIAVTSSRALHGIINDILDYAKIEAGRIDIAVEPFSLRSLLQDVIGLTLPIATSKKLALYLNIQEAVPDGLVGDVGRLRQILLNLVTNAIKFTNQGQVELRVLHMMTQSNDSQMAVLVRFEVVDTGIGISPADQNRLFKEFSQIERSFTRRFGGTGLGLAITQRLIRLMSGEIGVESRPGAGSKFWFIIPLPLAPPDSLPLAFSVGKDDEKPATKESQADWRLLLVEDNDTNRLIASRFLQKEGYVPDLACTGAEAVSLAQAKPYDLILMDVSMPIMDGLEATQYIRALGGWASKVPIIALTAHVMQGDRERCLAAGMNDYLNKPLEYEALVQMLERWLKVRTLSPDKELSPESDSCEPPEIDTSVLQSLAGELGKEAVLKITQVFLDDFSNRIENLREKSATLNIDNIQHAAHTLKSSSASCGLMRFAALMASLESAAGKGDKPRVQTLLLQVDPAYTLARQELVKERERYNA